MSLVIKISYYYYKPTYLHDLNVSYMLTDKLVTGVKKLLFIKIVPFDKKR